MRRTLVRLLLGLAAAMTALLVATPTGASPNHVIGTSAGGRPIEVACFGDGNRSLLLVGGLHTGQESVTSDIVIALAAEVWGRELPVPTEFEICFIPALNPDGLATGLHTNGNGVDLNRNWPASDWRPLAWHPETGTVSGGTRPLSEPETSALHAFISEHRPIAVMVWHCCGSLVEANEHPMAVRLADEYASGAAYYTLDDWTFYPISGEFIDAMDHLGIPAFDIEMTDPHDVDLATHRNGLSAVLEYLSR